MSDEDDTALAELLKPRVESELRQAYDREPTLLDELEDAIRRALEADEEFMSEVEKVKRQLGEGP